LEQKFFVDDEMKESLSHDAIVIDVLRTYLLTTANRIP